MASTRKRISPWKLTPKEAQAMDAMCEHGSAKLAARAIARSPKTIEARVFAATRKMGVINGGHLVKYIRWARWRWGEQVEGPTACRHGVPRMALAPAGPQPMGREELTRLAVTAGITLPGGPFPARGVFTLPELLHFAHLVADATRLTAAEIDSSAQKQMKGEKAS